MSIWNWLKQTPLWLVVPSVFLAAGVATAVTHYEPLVFDPSLYEVQTADAAELSTIDAEALEAANAADEPPADVELAAPSAAAASGAALADGTWTGYAACGQGNPDGWKPYYVGVTVNVSGGKSQGITRIFGSSTGNAGDAALSWDASENQSYLDWADAGRNGQTGVRAQVNAMASSGSLGNIDTVSKATYSSAAIYNAYVDALGKSAEAAGAAAPALPATPMPSGEDKPSQKKGKKPKKEKAEAKVGTLADGTWTAYAQCGPDPDDEWKPYYVGLTLTVEDGAVVSIDEIAGSSKGEKDAAKLDWDESENQAYLTWAVDGRTRSGVEYVGVKEQIESALAKGANPESIDVVSGATFSSQSVFKAFYAALAKSAKAVGASVDAPEGAEGAEGAESASDAAGVAEGSGDAQGGEQPVSDTADGKTVTGEGIPISGSFPDGVYTGHAFCQSDDSWQSYYVLIDVEARGGVIVSAANARGDSEGAIDPDYVYNAGENGIYFNRALKGVGRRAGIVVQIQQYLDALMNVGEIDTISKATISSNAIVAAFANAVENAQAAAGEGQVAVDDGQAATGAGDSPSESPDEPLPSPA